VGSLERRLKALEAGRAKDGRALSSEALRFLSDEDLQALADLALHDREQAATDT